MSRISAYFFCLYKALSSIFTLASTAKILLSDVFKTGLISNIDASEPIYALYKAVMNCVISLKAFPETPKLKAILLA
ncbi:hypothetical protein D3C80_1209660 [compost metagenome]